MAHDWSPVDDDEVRAHHEWLEGTDGSLTARSARRLADRTTRRGLLSRFGRLVIGAAGISLVPMLPLSRAAAQEQEGDTIDYTGTDPTSCNYWRYCNMSGRMCADCDGGGATTCPPGTVLGVEYWVGCCEDPATGNTYLIANYDCCGKTGCGGSCGEPFAQSTPADFEPGSRDYHVLWCMSDQTQTYTCSVTPIIGEGCTPQPAPRTRAEFEAMVSS